ncbi:hypothetical protein BJV78DRAFT_1223543 [Lactifluus subvellereus]|nr:hypothetical protein BJV78DRAFT_1223543 [Lactifluus subvellereus]
MTCESATSGLHLEVENIIVSPSSPWYRSSVLAGECLSRTLQIKRRRKRLLPPEPSLDESCMRAALDNIFPLLDFPFTGDGTGEGCSSPRDLFTSERQAGENGTSSLASSQACSHSAVPVAAPDHEGQLITVHEFLKGVTSKSGRKYGRRNRLATVKLDVARSEDGSSAPTPYYGETGSDGRISEYPRIQSKHPSRRVPRLRRKKHLAKSLAQRILEADVFSSGTSSRPTVQDPAHTSSRQPLQFVTSSNLTPSLEGRIRKRRQVDGAKRGSLPQMLAVSDSPAAPVEPPSRNQAATTQRTRTGGSGALLASRKKAFHVRGGKQSLARVPPGFYEYVPLPLVQVKTHRGAVQS